MSTAGKIGIVGPCSSGKSTLISGLRKHGYHAHHIAQEHSYAPTMWQRIGKPDVLVFLDVTFETAQKRRWLDWTEIDYEKQQQRLQHARQHAAFYLDTTLLTPQEVLDRVLQFLSSI